MSIEAPTGKEKPQKHYGSPYLNEIEDAQDRLRSAAATGTEADLSDIHATAIAAAVPNQGEILRGQSYNEANGDLDETILKAKAEIIAEKDAEAKANAEAKEGETKDANADEKSKDTGDDGKAANVQQTDNKKHATDLMTGKTVGDGKVPQTPEEAKKEEPKDIPKASTDKK